MAVQAQIPLDLSCRILALRLGPRYFLEQLICRRPVSHRLVGNLL